MLQTILTATFNITIAVSTVYFAIGLVLSLVSKFDRVPVSTATETTIDESTTVEEITSVEPETTVSIALPWKDAIVPFTRPIRKNFQSMNCDQLRSKCEENGIKWRHFHGKNRHLKKTEMIELLSA